MKDDAHEQDSQQTTRCQHSHPGDALVHGGRSPHNTGNALAPCRHDASRAGSQSRFGRHSSHEVVPRTPALCSHSPPHRGGAFRAQPPHERPDCVPWVSTGKAGMRNGRRFRNRALRSAPFRGSGLLRRYVMQGVRLGSRRALWGALLAADPPRVTAGVGSESAPGSRRDRREHDGAARPQQGAVWCTRSRPDPAGSTTHVRPPRARSPPRVLRSAANPAARGRCSSAGTPSCHHR